MSPTRPAGSLSRKEGWRRFADAPPRQRPETLPRAQLAALGEASAEDYNDSRHDWHANFGIVQTPQLAGVHDELEQIVAGNRQDGDRTVPQPSSTHCRAWARPPSPTCSAANSIASRCAACPRSPRPDTNASPSSASA
ncbi:hypothetical protein [Streptomyces atratus]|uniref:hypothetical protein n=1 Tax=Streptomyces atratus TaxID=1893 RepID=UPI003663A4A2